MSLRDENSWDLGEILSEKVFLGWKRHKGGKKIDLKNCHYLPFKN